MAERQGADPLQGEPTISGEEPLGRRLAALRAKLGWTQQEVADRLAISRTAVSHLEAGMTVAGERTVVLLAGLYGLEPHELVAGTSYPRAKATRLPAIAARHTDLDLLVHLVDQDRWWLARLTLDDGDPARVAALAVEAAARWRARLAELEHRRPHLDTRARRVLDDAWQQVRRLEDPV